MEPRAVNKFNTNPMHRRRSSASLVAGIGGIKPLSLGLRASQLDWFAPSTPRRVPTACRGRAQAAEVALPRRLINGGSAQAAVAVDQPLHERGSHSVLSELTMSEGVQDAIRHNRLVWM